MDKIAHCALYAVLGATLASGRFRASSSVPHVVLLVLGALYGISDEWHQAWVPGRDPDPADWLADVVGLALGYGTTMSFLGRTKDHGTMEGSR
jgi:VanZ family protein